jgi:hypothetical protein
VADVSRNPVPGRPPILGFIVPSPYDNFLSWARERTAFFAELRFLAPERGPVKQEGDGLIYRLRHWPELPAAGTTADVLRTLSLMSNQPVTRHWLLGHSRLPARQLDQLLQWLANQGAVEVIDTSGYEPD